MCVSNKDCGAYAVCAYDGTKDAVKRCICIHGYVLLMPNGHCGDGFGDGCVCPSHKSGWGCTTTHEVSAVVTCDVSSFTMRICYTPQSTYNGVAPVMIVDGKGADVSCTGVVSGLNDRICSVGQYKLILPLDDHARGRCGTTKLSSGITTTKYMNTISIQNRLFKNRADAVSFNASCSFDSHAKARFDPMSIAVHKMDDKPILNLHVKNHLGYTIPEGVALRLGDNIRLKLVLVDAAGTYSALRVVGCIASTSPSTSDPIAVIIPLVSSRGIVLVLGGINDQQIAEVHH